MNFSPAAPLLLHIRHAMRRLRDARASACVIEFRLHEDNTFLAVSAQVPTSFNPKGMVGLAAMVLPLDTDAILAGRLNRMLDETVLPQLAQAFPVEGATDTPPDEPQIITLN